MTITLTNPDPAELGFASPALGPWFSNDKSLAEPDGDLGLAVNFSAGESWLPASSGLLSLFVAGTERPYSIAGLRKSGGGPAFTDNRVIAVFRLLDEVEERLHALGRFLPPVTAAPPSGEPTPAAAATRARVRTFALELAATLDPTSPDDFIDRIGAMIVPELPSYVGRDLSEAREIRRAKAAYLGLDIPTSGVELVQSGTRPMNDLKRAGKFDLSGGGLTPEPEKLLKFPNGMSTRLFVFDDRGLPLDPGAVAIWWKFLAVSAFDNLWAEGFEGAERRTASISGGARFTIHLVNPHGGHLPNDAPLLQRTEVTGVSDLPDATAARNLRSSTSGGVTLSFSAPDSAASADNAPFPRAALLPEGRFSSTAQAWVGDWTGFTINRDFIQIALVEVESHLIGVPRLLPEGTGNPVARRRAADQNRVTTRTHVARAAGDILKLTLDAANQSVLDVFDGTGAAALITSAADRDYGTLNELSGLPAGRPPDQIPEFTGAIPSGAEELKDANGRRVGAVHPVTGGERLTLVELALGTDLAGAWVRIWAQDFDPTTGSRKRLDGGAGRADSSGRALALVQLEVGATGTDSPSGLDLLIKTAEGAREYPDLRFRRPAPITGSAIALNTATNVILCETGESLTTAGLANAVPSGMTLVALAGDGRTNPALIDPASIPAGAFTDTTLIRKLDSGDVLVLSQPAFIKQPGGSITAAFDGITVQRFVRNGIERIRTGSALAAGAPLPSQERLETVAARVDSSGGGTASAALSAGAALARMHELFPHQQGHPGAPASAEMHAAGIALDGAAGLLLAEYVRDRQERSSAGLVSDAFNTPFPALSEPPSGDAALWAAVLRTSGKGSEGEAGMDALADILVEAPTTPGTIARDVERWVRNRNIDADTSSLSADVQAVIAALNTILAALPPSGPSQERNVASAARALDRRLQASRGIREGALSLLAAVNRAEDFIYMETPALDTLSCGSGDEQIGLLTAIKNRLNDSDHRALKLILCVPLKYSPFVPQPMQTVRDVQVKAAVESLRSLPFFDQRVALITPNAGSGRSLYLAGTTVIVDDAFLFTGSTHLWRRGLAFDSSLSAALFDESVEAGRPRLIRQARRALIAGRLGLDVELVPENPSDLMEALRLLPNRDGGRRLTTRSVLSTKETATTTDNDIWNPDASPGSGFDIATFLASLIAIREHVPPAP